MTLWLFSCRTNVERMEGFFVRVLGHVCHRTPSAMEGRKSIGRWEGSSLQSSVPKTKLYPLGHKARWQPLGDAIRSVAHKLSKLRLSPFVDILLGSCRPPVCFRSYLAVLLGATCSVEYLLPCGWVIVSYYDHSREKEAEANTQQLQSSRCNVLC